MVQKSRAWASYANRGPYIGNVVVESYVAHWDTSPRVNGQLRLRANGYQREHWVNHTLTTDGKGTYLPDQAQLPGAHASARGAQASAYSEAYGRFRGRLYQGGASLGVTAGSYKQSREMIVNRSRSISRQAEEIFSDFGRRYSVRGRAAKRLASNYLEVVFGWQPLVSDIKNAALTVIQLADKRESSYGRASRSYYVNLTDVSSNGERKTETRIGGAVQVTVASLVTISNPNRWLLERAGLLNIGAVAWDLVPWSFVINMIANTGQLVNSITDFAGLSFGNQSVTTTYREGGVQATSLDRTWAWPPPGGRLSSRASSGWSADRKIRTVGDIPRPSLVVKLPGANWELACIASSLMVQQASRVGMIIRELRSR